MTDQLRGHVTPRSGLLVPVVLHHRLQVTQQALHQARQAGLAPVEGLTESEHLAEFVPALCVLGEGDDLVDGSLHGDAAVL